MARTESDRSASEPFRLEASVSHLLHRAEQLAGDRFARLMGDGVTLRQFTVLAAIAEKPGLNQSELVASTGIDRSTAAELIARLQRRGWIARNTSASDRRAYALELTEAGASALASGTPHARAADAAILDALARSKRKAFLNTLTKLAAFADALAAAAKRDARREAKRAEKKPLKAKEKAKHKRRKKPAKPRGKRA